MRLTPQRSCRGGILIQILVFLVCACGMLVLGWMLLLPGLFTSVIEKRTGFPARVDYFYANPFTAEVRLRGLVIANPADFKEADFLVLRQFTAKADLFTLLGERPVLDMSTIDVARISIVTNAKGTNNLDLLYRRLGSPALGDKKPKNSKVAANSPLQFLVRNLDLHISEVVVADERPDKNTTKTHDVAFQEVYRNVTPATHFNPGASPAMVAAGKNAETLVTGNLRQLVTGATQPEDRSTYAWRKQAEIEAENARKLEEKQKP